MWSYFYETGELKQEIEYNEGIENGEFKLFHENGLLAYTGMIVNGKHQGLWKEYYENGQIQEESMFTDDTCFPVNFWRENGEQILIKGTGMKIAKYGTESMEDVYEQYFDNGKFVKEIKIKGYKFLGFVP